MPIYEYYCSDCRTKFSALRPMARADAPIACEHCGGARTGRVLSTFFAHGSDGAVRGAGGGGACGSCAGGSCSTCGQN